MEDTGLDESATVISVPRRGFAMALMVVSSIVISFSALFMRSMEAAGPWQVNLYKSLATIFAVAVILLIQYRGETLARIRGVGRAGFFGGCLLAAAGILFLQALSLTTAANTLFTLSAIPFFTAGLAWVFLKERLRPLTLATMVVAAAGIFVMVADGIGSGSLAGNLFALATAACFSGFAVIVRHWRGIDMLPTMIVSSLIIVAVALAFGWNRLGVSLYDLVLCFIWGALLSGFSNWTFIIASRHLVAAEVTLFMLLEFALGPLWVWMFIGETANAATLADGALVIGAVLFRAVVEIRRGRGRPTRGRVGAPP